MTAFLMIILGILLMVLAATDRLKDLTNAISGNAPQVAKGSKP